MFRKKTVPPHGRNVRQQPSAQVFSYYASRSPSTTYRQSMPQKPARKPRRSISARQLASYAPSLFAGGLLLLCLGYASTLDGNAKLQIAGSSTDHSLVADVEAYETEIRTIFGASMLNRSKLSIDTDGIARQLQEEFPELGEVAVVLPLVGRRPVVQIRPAKPALVLRTLQGALVIDAHGRAIADAADVESVVLDTLPSLQDESGLSIERGEYALPRQTVNFAKIVAAQLSSKALKIRSMVLPASTNEMHVRLEGRPYYVKFNAKGDGRVQAGTLIATQKKLDRDKVVPKTYIDVRVTGKVFYR